MPVHVPGHEESRERRQCVPAASLLSLCRRVEAVEVQGARSTSSAWGLNLSCGYGLFLDFKITGWWVAQEYGAHPCLTTWVPFPKPTVEGENWLWKLSSDFMCYWYIKLQSVWDWVLSLSQCVCARGWGYEGKKRERGRRDTFSWSRGLLSSSVHLTLWDSHAIIEWLCTL